MSLYLTRLVLNPESPRVQAELMRPYQLHRTLWRAFGENASGRLLYRLETDAAVPVLLVQSPRSGDWGHLSQVGYLHEPHELLLENPAEKLFTLRFEPGQVLRFRLRANPTYKAGGRRLGHLNPQWQPAWLARKGAQSGFSVVEGVGRGEGFQALQKGPQRLRMYSVLFEGLLQVQEAEGMAEAIRNGVGSGKGFGFGLLSVKSP
ncbi:MAG: type I-E CRISPR-associated protein Cas6/Cse3/CasE [Armatimonadia bacterium]